MSQLIIKETSSQDRRPPRWVQDFSNRYDRGRWSTTHRAYTAKPRLYVHVDGENILENLAFRTNRPSRLYREILPAAFKKLGIPGDTKAYWSQKAGCSCGCSPGFVLDFPRDVIPERKDYWVTVTARDDATDAKVVPSAEAMAEASSRLSQLEQQGVLEALAAAQPSSQQTGRSGSGNLRNFKAMTEDKFRDVARAIAAEDNDPEAQAAVKEEAYRRATS